MIESTKMTIFGESIKHNRDYDIPSKFREPVDEIHRNICPNPCTDGKGFEQAREECSFTLVALESITFSNHLFVGDTLNSSSVWYQCGEIVMYKNDL